MSYNHQICVGYTWAGLLLHSSVIKARLFLGIHNYGKTNMTKVSYILSDRQQQQQREADRRGDDGTTWTRTDCGGGSKP